MFTITADAIGPNVTGRRDLRFGSGKTIREARRKADAALAKMRAEKSGTFTDFRIEGLPEGTGHIDPAFSADRRSRSHMTALSDKRKRARERQTLLSLPLQWP